MGNWVRTVPPDGAARSHLARNLTIGANDHSVSAQLLARLPTVSLSFSVAAFRELSECELRNLCFAYGRRGEAYTAGFSSVDVLVEEARAFFSQYEHGIVVLEHATGKRTYPRIRELPWRVRFLGDEVYILVTAVDTQSDAMEEAIREAWGAYWFTCFFVGRGEPTWLEEKDLPHGFPIAVCEGLRMVCTEAFDGEGLLVAEHTMTT